MRGRTKGAESGVTRQVRGQEWVVVVDTRYCSLMDSGFRTAAAVDLAFESCALERGVAGRRGSVKKNVAPSPGFDSTQIRPPCASTTFLQIASPAPVPSTSSRR